MCRRRLPLLFVLAIVLAPSLAHAQQPMRRWEPRGFDFSAHGVWRRRAQAVRSARMAALARSDLFALNAPLAGAAALMAAPGSPQPGALAVTGTLYAPVFLVAFRNTAAGGLASAATYDAVLFGSTPPAGRPFTVRTFYEQMSNNLLSVRGQSFGWVALDSNDTWYEGSCNALGCGSAHLPQLMREAVQKTDATVDFGQYDNDGPDGIPNSPDDDGRVDLMILVHPEVGAECQQITSGVASNIWSHRWAYSSWTGVTFATADPRRDGNGVPIPGQSIVVDDYIIQPGVGGANACTAGDLMPIGTIAHELGHGLDLPDLYDTDPFDSDDSEGIGEWGLMSSGNYARPLSPAHMEGWSRLQLGWVTVRDLGASGTYEFGAYTVADTIFRILPTGTNPRNESFLIENRQPQEGDTALIGKGKAPGLLIYHIDGEQVQTGSMFGGNRVNSGTIHGVWILQADGLDQLRSSTSGFRNRGDSLDPFPGGTGNRALGYGTTPDNRMNFAGAFPGFAIDSIRQVVPGGAMSLRFVLGALTVVRASDSTALIRFRGAPAYVVRDLFGTGDTATVDVDSVQLSEDARTRFRFVSWSDGQPRTHLVTLSDTGGTRIATLERSFRADFTAAGGGSIVAGGAVASGTYLADGDSVVLTTQCPAGTTFVGWTGDTATTNPTLVLRMRRPWTVVGNFQGQLAVADSVLRPGVMGAPYADTLRMSGASGTYTYTRLAGTLPTGLTLSAGGEISGTPTRDSAFTFTVRAASGGQYLDLPLQLVVAAPTLAGGNVVTQLLAGGTALTADELRYMDLQGNGNGLYDVGDVLAWLDRHPGMLSPGAMRRLAAGARP